MNFRILSVFVLAGSFLTFGFVGLAVAYSTPTSCGKSPDGGAYGFVQIYIPPPNAGQLYGESYIYQYASGANAVLYGYGDPGIWYPIGEWPHYFTGANQGYTVGPVNYAGTYARIHVYDGSSNVNAGTFDGIIFFSGPNPRCPYQSPTR